MRSKKYTAEILGPIVERSRSLADVMRALGLTPNGGNHRMMAAHIRRIGLDISHFGLLRFQDRVQAIPLDELERLIRSSTSLAQVLSAVELPTEGRAHHLLKERIKKLGLDTSHHRGHGWSRGETASSHASVARVRAAHTFSNEEVFIENGPLVGGPRLKARLLAIGWPYACAICGIAEWCGAPLVLHVDHRNGINNDNRLQNLRFLCPNCHSQTETYCNRARGKPSRASESRGLCYMFSS